MRKGISSLALVTICCLSTLIFAPRHASGQPWLYPHAAPEVMIFDNGNIYAVFNGPSGRTTFTIQERYRITRITNYHWNFQKGVKPGTISLRDGAGNVLGRWQASSRPGQGGVPDAYWDVYPDIDLNPGRYIVVDSDPSTWSSNPENNNRGMSQVYGHPSR